MESNNDTNLKAINESVGRLVWVRRGNGSWWPGQTLFHDQVPLTSLSSSRIGTPIKLLCREDVNVDWYVLEKSKNVKAFRCGEYDDCIVKAKAVAALASSSNKKKTIKCTRRESAINIALEIENAHLVKDDTNRCVSGKEDLGSDKADSKQELLQSGMSLKAVQPKRRRRRTPNDSEEDGTERIKRMRGLDDIEKEYVGAVFEHRQEPGLICGSMSNGYSSLSSPKRERSRVINVNGFTKRKNRRRQMTKVLESSVAMVCVPVTCNHLVSSDCQVVYDSNNNSESTGVTCENASETDVQASQHNNNAKESEISSLSVSAEDDCSDQLYDVPLTGEEKQSAGFLAACTTSSSSRALVSGLTRRSSRSSSHDVFVKEEMNNVSAYANPTATQLVIHNPNTSKWRLKGKRNSRQMSKKQEAGKNMYSEEANSELYEVKIEVKADSNRRHNVPMVSRMSKFNGKAIVGHPLTVEAIDEDGYCNGMVMSRAIVKAKSLTKKKKSKKRKSNGGSRKVKKKPEKTRRLSTLTSQSSSKRMKTGKEKETVLACIPLKIVFSRINQLLKGSKRQTRHRALSSLGITLKS
ncbi:unnamed protein product [Cochlearia groenlandica]